MGGGDGRSEGRLRDVRPRRDLRGGQRAFCSHSELGRSCLGAIALICNDDGSAIHRNWYQAAINWAHSQGYRKVALDAGTITVTNQTKLAWGFPWNGGVGIHVPPGVHLEGSMIYDRAPSVINVAPDVGELSALVLVHDAGGNRQLFDAGVSYLTLVGTAASGRSQGELCPSRGHRVESINDLDADPPQMPDDPGPIALSGTMALQVGETIGTGASVDAHHLRIAHFGGGIAYGWNTNQVKEDASCVTEPGITLDIQAKGAGPCPAGSYEKPLAVKRSAAMCRPLATDPSGRAIGCDPPEPPDPEPAGEKTAYCVAERPRTVAARYCAIMPFEYVGNPSARSQVHHNSICDVKTGVNIVGGNVDVTKNVLIRYPTSERNIFGLSTDGHWPYSHLTTHAENFVRGFQTGFLSDGSQYAVVSESDFKTVTGYYPKDFTDKQDWLDLQQHIYDDAQRYFFSSDPWSGYIDRVYLRDNRLFDTVIGVSFYRVNWGFAGFNVIRSQDGSGDAGLILSNSINSWAYGNTIESFPHGIRVEGKPGVQSAIGSCYNGLGVYCSAPGCPKWEQYPNVFAGSNVEGGVPCNVVYRANYCAARGVPPFTPSPPGAPYQCFAQ